MASDEEISDEAIADTLAAIGQDFDEKAEGYVFVLKRTEIDAAAVRAQAEELEKIVQSFRDKADMINRRADRIKKALAGAMLETGRTNLKTSLFSISVRKTQAVRMPKDFDIYSLPVDFIHYPEPKAQADKAKIKKYLQRGGEIPGITLEENSSLIIR
ncbi:MAG: siphovirus Gp157 family protein [Bacteroidales bacterium]|nr:siphovirus Gp157 family protein [Bacteroidales bacterium]